MKRRIAIIGGGISGLGAAWALGDDHSVTLYEADRRLGGHSNTVDIELDGVVHPVDTGFIVYNEVTYPHLTRLFSDLGVITEPSDMSFSFSVQNGLEYGASLRGLLAHPHNLLHRRYRRMVGDILRFRKHGPELVAIAGDEDLGEFLYHHGYSGGFIEDYILPMTGAVWSARRSEIRRFPAGPMLRFLMNHGLIEIVGRPRWRTVTGGSRQYVSLLAQACSGAIRTATPVAALDRSPTGVVVHTEHESTTFDEVVIATHSDQALRLLGGSATAEETAALSAIRYEPNRVVLHSDSDLMPRSRSAWSSWNSFARNGEVGSGQASVTYWMNRLQNLTTTRDVFVTLNPIIEPTDVHAEFEYAHPQFDASAVAAQKAINRFQGHHHTWFAGAYLGYGFHEDGLQSGLNVAAALGSETPWLRETQPMSSALPIPAMA